MTDLPRLHVDLTAFDRARPYVSRLLGSVGAALAYAAIQRWGHYVGVTELSELWRQSIEIAATGAVYGVVHKACDSRINQTDAARPTVVALANASPIGSASEGAAVKAAAEHSALSAGLEGDTGFRLPDEMPAPSRASGTDAERAPFDPARPMVADHDEGNG